MKKKTIGALTISALAVTTICSAMLLNKNVINVMGTRAAAQDFSITFDKSTWNDDYSKNSAITSHGNEKEIGLVGYGSAGLAPQYGDDVDGIAKLYHNGALLYFNFPIQTGVSLVINFSGNVGTDLKVFHGDSAQSRSGNGGYYSTSGNAKSLSYYGSDKYFSIAYELTGDATAGTDNWVTIESVTLTYSCAE